MDHNTTHAYNLTQLGIRVFYTPGRDTAVNEDSALSYYSHSHPYYELHLIRQGHIALQAGVQTHELDPDTFCLISPEISHSLKSSILGVRRRCIGLSITDPEMPAAGYLLAQTRNIPSRIGNAQPMEPILRQLSEEEAGVPFSEEMVSLLLSQLILQLLREIRCRTAPVASASGDLNDLRTVHIDQFLNNNFHLRGAQQTLAAELGLSRRQLDRVFQNLYGISFREKLLQVRAEAACDLLAGSLSIGQIALQVGYSSSANFTAFFRGIKGITPTQYRKNLKDH